jgi:hypothetical protein
VENFLWMGRKKLNKQGKVALPLWKTRAMFDRSERELRRRSVMDSSNGIASL